MLSEFFPCDLIAHADDDEEIDVISTERQKEYIEEALDESTVYSSGITSYSSYMVSYFDNLTYNFGMNYKGSCGYVAIGMMLSYYDTYLDDDIVPEQYDVVSSGYDTDMVSWRNSPGIMRDIIANPSNSSNTTYGIGLDADDYYSKIVSLQTSSLHAKLISIGASMGYYNFSNDDLPAGTSFNSRLNIINTYMTDVLVSL